jgi:hypothetical protein
MFSCVSHIVHWGGGILYAMCYMLVWCYVWCWNMWVILACVWKIFYLFMWPANRLIVLYFRYACLWYSYVILHLTLIFYLSIEVLLKVVLKVCYFIFTLCACVEMKKICVMYLSASVYMVSNCFSQKFRQRGRLLDIWLLTSFCKNKYTSKMFDVMFQHLDTCPVGVWARWLGAFSIYGIHAFVLGVKDTCFYSESFHAIFLILFVCLRKLCIWLWCV